jgi:hypothetical protein
MGGSYPGLIKKLPRYLLGRAEENQVKPVRIAAL